MVPPASRFVQMPTLPGVRGNSEDQHRQDPEIQAARDRESDLARVLRPGAGHRLMVATTSRLARPRPKSRRSCKLKAQIGSAYPAARLHAEALGGLLSIELLRLLQDGAPASRPSPRGGLAVWQQKRVMDFIEEHLSEDVSLDVLADLVRLSPYHFLRSFKQSFGEPPYRYWTGRRIERAKALLANPRTSVTEIALAVGFHGTSAFSATFHRVTGQTPTDYRRDLE